MIVQGIWPDESTFTITNTIVTRSGTDFDQGISGGTLTGSYNSSSDTTAGTYFTNFQNSIDPFAVFVDPDNDNLHLDPGGGNVAVDTGLDLTGFVNDIDDQFRPRASPWDRGADERDALTAVTLVSFTASAADGAVELAWETSSELNNLGFHLYRATAPGAAYQRITTRAIPGLGSSPVGARYSYRDGPLENGVTYYYELEDIETTGARKMHGPVSATPGSSVSTDEIDTGSQENAPNDGGSRIVYGDPTANTLNVVKRGRNQLVLELVTKGFYAEPQDDGAVRLTVPGFDALSELDEPDVPVKRTWVEALAGRKVKLKSVSARGVEAFTSLRPSEATSLEIVQTVEGTVRARRRKVAAAFRRDGLYPASAASIQSVGFQGDVKKALVELAPLRWDGTTGQLLMARRLVVKISFAGREPSEASSGGARGRGYLKPPSHDRRNVVARIVTKDRGLYGVRYEDVMRGRRAVRAKTLRLTRQGAPVAFHIEPRSNRFAPGSILYFVSEGASSNPYGTEAGYELEKGAFTELMPEASAEPVGEPTSYYWQRGQWEEDRYYQAGLVDAPDIWLGDSLFAPETKSYPFEVTSLAASSEPARLSVHLQGVSDFGADPDHHVRVRVNGSLVAHAQWNGKAAAAVEVELLPGLLVEGENRLELENVGNTGAQYSMVMLDRFAVSYPRLPVADEGKLEGQWRESGTSGLAGMGPGSLLLDVTGERPKWLTGSRARDDGTIELRVEAGRSYLAVAPSAVLDAEVRKPSRSTLKRARNRADYLLIGPRAFLDVAAPLMELRRNHGLRVKAVPVEEIYEEFGFGEETPEAVQDFLSYAYHNWRRPSPRYVVLLGDATFDFEDRFQTGVVNHVPPLMVKTRFLWTVSDPALAAVNGDDLLPDLAIGRLPVASVEEATVLIEKIAAYENDADSSVFGAPVVLVADNADEAGDFEADADELADGPLSARVLNKIYLSELGQAAAKSAILETFDEGVSLMSYLGHGGIALWADENILSTWDTSSLGPQRRQPILLTMNCLNGYFHFPFFDSLSESLLKADGKGAIAAFSPSGLSVNRFAHQYHEALLGEIFSGTHERLGDATLTAQMAYAESGSYPELLSIFHLLGDPALRLR